LVGCAILCGSGGRGSWMHRRRRRGVVIAQPGRPTL
jgi:hypothetical protein